MQTKSLKIVTRVNMIVSLAFLCKISRLLYVQFVPNERMLLKIFKRRGWNVWNVYDDIS